MTIFLYGQDSYRTNEKLKELVNGYKAKNPSGLNFTSLDSEENILQDLAKYLKSNSLILEKKLIVVKNILKSDPHALIDVLEKYRVSKSEEIILIAVSFASADSKNELFKYLTQKPNLTTEFALLEGVKLKNWIQKQAQNFGIELDGQALDYLIDNVGPNLWQQDEELKKLASYKISGLVRLADVEKLVSPKVYINVFDLADAIGTKNKKRAIYLWHQAIESGEEPIQLLALLAWQVRNLLKVKNSANPRNLGLHPYALEKTLRQARFFETDELKSMLTKLGGLDLALKTSNIEPKNAFLDFIIYFEKALKFY